MNTDFGIETLLDLHEEAFDQGDGYWVKIEAWRVLPTPAIPHASSSLPVCGCPTITAIDMRPTRAFLTSSRTHINCSWIFSLKLIGCSKR